MSLLKAGVIMESEAGRLTAKRIRKRLNAYFQARLQDPL
jgi:hypothetical protein